MALTRVSYGFGQFQSRILYGVDPMQRQEDIDQIYNNFSTPRDGGPGLDWEGAGLTPEIIYGALARNSQYTPGTPGFLRMNNTQSAAWNAKADEDFARADANRAKGVALEADRQALLARSKATYDAELASGARQAPINYRALGGTQAPAAPMTKTYNALGTGTAGSSMASVSHSAPAAPAAPFLAALAPSRAAPVRAAALPPSSTVVRYASLPPSSSVTRTAALKPSSAVVRYASLKPSAPMRSSWSSVGSRYSTGR